MSLIISAPGSEFHHLLPCLGQLIHDKCINIKLPVTGQVNALDQTETDLELGDIIFIRMDIPRNNTVDIYCNAQSVKLGDALALIAEKSLHIEQDWH